MRHFLPAVSLVMLVLISGCVSTEVFGGDVIQTDIKIEEQGAKDVLIVKDIQTIPKSPLLPSQSFTLFFTLENLDSENNARNVIIKLFDPSVFKDSSGTACTSKPKGCEPTSCSTSAACSAILPSEQKQIQFALKSPSEAEIAKIKLDTEVFFSVDYEFDASTFFEVPVVTEQEIEQRQRADQSISITSSNVQSSGPVQIDAEIKGTQFILAGQDANFIFTIKNKGDKNKGNVVNSQIGKNKIEIVFPTQLIVTGSPITPPTQFTCVSNKCTNTKEEINLFKGESIPLKFTIPSTNKNNIPPFAKYPLTARINGYSYQLRDKAMVTIQPFK